MMKQGWRQASKQASGASVGAWKFEQESFFDSWGKPRFEANLKTSFQAHKGIEIRTQNVEAGIEAGLKGLGYINWKNCRNKGSIFWPER